MKEGIFPIQVSTVEDSGPRDLVVPIALRGIVSVRVLRIFQIVLIICRLHELTLFIASPPIKCLQIAKDIMPSNLDQRAFLTLDKDEIVFIQMHEELIPDEQSDPFPHLENEVLFQSCHRSCDHPLFAPKCVSSDLELRFVIVLLLLQKVVDAHIKYMVQISFLCVLFLSYSFHYHRIVAFKCGNNNVSGEFLEPLVLGDLFSDLRVVSKLVLRLDVDDPFVERL